MLGRDLVATAPANVEVVATGRDQVDITQARVVTSFLKERSPQLVVNAAGYTNVDGAEAQPDIAFSVNGNAVGSLAVACSDRNVPLVHSAPTTSFPGTRLGRMPSETRWRHWVLTVRARRWARG